MRDSIIYELDLRNGVKAKMFFAPSLYAFKGFEGVTFEAKDNGVGAAFAEWADVMFCAALRYWDLSGQAKYDEEGNISNAPFHRIDFHETMVTNPESFGKALNFALKALTGKSLKSLLEEQNKGQRDAIDAELDSKKKERTHRIGILSRLFS